MNYITEEELRENLRWLINLRWAGIVGVLVGTHLVRELAFLDFSLIPVYGVLGFVSLYNLYFKWSLKARKGLLKQAVFQVFLDQISLGFAVYFSGGCDSPFIYFFLFHVVISGIILPYKWAFLFSTTAVLIPLTVMGLKHYGILPHYGIFRNEPMIFTDLTVMTSYGAVFISTLYLTAYFVTYLSRRLYQKNEEIKRLYKLSERLRSTIRLYEVISLIEKELCSFAGAVGGLFIGLDKERRLLTVRKEDREVLIPMVDRNTFTEAILKGTSFKLNRKLLTSDYEREVFELLEVEECLILPVTAASIYNCWEYFQCPDRECRAYGNTTTKCWYIAGTHCKGRLMRNNLEKLNECLSCELFTAVGLYCLAIPSERLSLEKIDTDACMRLLDAAGLAIANSLLYERTLALSRTDSLTGLLNNRTFKEALHSEFLRAKRFQKSFGIIMLDIDHFKRYNDTHGHPQGDILIKKIGDIIRENLKDTDIVARYGGEEFAIILPETPKEQAIIIAERLRSLIEWCRFPGEDSQPGGRITTSLGVAGYPEDGNSPEELLEAADNALYRAKKEGRNRVVVA